MTESEMRVRASEKNGIFTAASVRFATDNNNAKLDISKLIMEKIIDAATAGNYFIDMDFETNDNEVIKNIRGLIRDRVLPLFEHYGYTIQISSWFQEDRPGYRPCFKCHFYIKW